MVSQNGIQTVTKESQCITNECNDLTLGDWRTHADKLFLKFKETIRLKAKGILQKHYNLVDKDIFPWGFGLIVLKPL